jgi:hypothetical protein
VAIFTGLSIDRAGTGYTLRGTATGLTLATSAPFDVTAGSADYLEITVQPGTTTAGAAITPTLQVTARDAQGNTVTGFTGFVSVAITSGTGTAGAALSGTTTVAAASGVASFPGLSIDKSGTGYRLRVTSSGLTPDTSAVFNINPGAAAVLVFTRSRSPCVTPWATPSRASRAR